MQNAMEYHGFHATVLAFRAFPSPASCVLYFREPSLKLLSFFLSFSLRLKGHGSYWLVPCFWKSSFTHPFFIAGSASFL